jgi:hypothetical protein
MSTSNEQEIIEEGDLVVEGRFVDASNATLFAHAVLGDEKVPVIYKPIAGERPLWDFPDGNLASREVAAYKLSQEIGLGLVPFTILRDGPFGIGSVQQWIEVDEDLDLLAYVADSPDALRKMALFDAIINNTDRKFGHILIDPHGEIYGCDHGVCFHSDDKLRTVLWNWSGQPLAQTEIEILRQASRSTAVVAELLTAKELAALDQRIASLLEYGIFPEPSDQWPSVPFPPY